MERRLTREQLAALERRQARQARIRQRMADAAVRASRRWPTDRDTRLAIRVDSNYLLQLRDCTGLWTVKKTRRGSYYKKWYSYSYQEETVARHFAAMMGKAVKVLSIENRTSYADAYLYNANNPNDRSARCYFDVKYVKEYTSNDPECHIITSRNQWERVDYFVVYNEHGETFYVTKGQVEEGLLGIGSRSVSNERPSHWPQNP